MQTTDTANTTTLQAEIRAAADHVLISSVFSGNSATLDSALDFLLALLDDAASSSSASASMEQQQQAWNTNNKQKAQLLMDAAQAASLVGICIKMFLPHDENPQLHFTTAALLHHLSAAHPMRCEDHCAPVVLQLLESPIEAVVVFGATVCARVAEQGEGLRDHLIGAVGPLVSIIERCLCLPNSAGGGSAFHCPETLECAIWAATCLNRHMPKLDLRVYSGLLPLLPLLLVHPSPTVQVWALSMASLMSNGPADRVVAVLVDTKLDGEGGGGVCVLDLVHKLLNRCWSATATLPLLRICGNVAATNTSLVQELLLDSGMLATLSRVYRSRTDDAAWTAPMKKELFWLCSNIAVGSDEQRQAMLDSKLIPHVIDAVATSPASFAEAQREACWCVLNMAVRDVVTSSDVCMQLVAMGAVEAFVKSLDSGDDKVRDVALEGLLLLLQASDSAGDEEHRVTGRIRDAGGIEAISKLAERDDDSSSQTTVSARAIVLSAELHGFLAAEHQRELQRLDAIMAMSPRTEGH